MYWRENAPSVGMIGSENLDVRKKGCSHWRGERFEISDRVFNKYCCLSNICSDATKIRLGKTIV